MRSSYEGWCLIANAIATVQEFQFVSKTMRTTARPAKSCYITPKRTANYTFDHT